MTQREQQILDWITEDPMISQEALAEAGGDYPLFGGGAYLQPDEEGPHCGPGYILPAGGYVVVAGAVNVDIGGQSAGRWWGGIPTPARLR